MCGYFTSQYACILCMYSFCRAQKMSEALELALQLVVSHRGCRLPNRRFVPLRGSQCMSAVCLEMFSYIIKAPFSV